MYFSYSNEQMRRADQRTIERGTPERELMLRAGRALADAVKSACKRLNVTDPLFVCGGGNNGGDGFVAARLLCDEGFSPCVLCMAKNFSSACKVERDAYRGEVYGRPIRRRFAVIVDCVLGTGITRSPEGEAKLLIEYIANSGAYVVSADIPSGLGEGGVAYTPCVKADETVTMGQLKHALLLESGRDLAGKITLADIEISSDEKGAKIYEGQEISTFFPNKKSRTNKGSYGSACIVAGDPQASGAVFLAASGCLKSGVGYTKLAVGKKFYPLVIGKFPACVLFESEGIDEKILSCDAVAIGMGAGESEDLYQTICALLREYRGTLVIDADGLNSLAKFGVEVLKNKSCKVVLTPHVKELSRLTGMGVEKITSDMVGVCKSFAAEMGCIVLLKSNSSVISDGEEVAINLEGSPVLAKGGSGDVLAGFLTGTLARGVMPFEACVASAFVLGRSGAILAKEQGEYSPDATDIANGLGRAILSLSRPSPEQP